MSVNVWTVNNKKAMKKMLRLGVDMITTDNPLDAREVISNTRINEIR